MKFTGKIFPSGSLVKHRGGLQKVSRDLRTIKLSDTEIAVYREQKINRDIKFFESAIPYFSGLFIGITVLFFSINGYNYYYEKRTGQSIWRKLYFNLLDIDEIEVKRE